MSDCSKWFTADVAQRHESAGNFIQAVRTNPDDESLYGSGFQDVEKSIRKLGTKFGFRNLFDETGFGFPIPVKVDRTESSTSVFNVTPISGLPFTDCDSEKAEYTKFMTYFLAEFDEMEKSIEKVAEGSKVVTSPEPKMPCFARWVLSRVTT